MSRHGKRGSRWWVRPLTAARHGADTIVPPRDALAQALLIVVAIAPVAAVAGLVAGSDAVLAVLLGLASGAGVAVATPSPQWRAALVVATGLAAAAGAAGHGHAVAVAVIVALAAMVQAPFSIRVGAVATMLPAVAATFGSVGGQWYVAGLWSAAGAAAITIVVTVINLTGPSEPVPSAVAWRHAVVTALAAGTAAGLSVHWSVPHGYWAVVTLCVVLHPVRGETSRRALDRFAGTATGAVLAGVLATALPVGAGLAVAAVCALLMLGWSVAANERKQLIFLTPVVVLVGSSGLSSTALDLAVGRTVLSTLGAAVAVVLALALHAYERRRRPRPVPEGDG